MFSVGGLFPPLPLAQRTQRGEDGSYLMRNLRPGKLRIQARRKGYVPVEGRVEVTGTAEAQLRMALVPATEGRVRVEDPGGVPVSLTRVFVKAECFGKDFLRGSIPVQLGVTDAAGELVIRELPAGTHTLWVMHPEFGRGKGSIVLPGATAVVRLAQTGSIAGVLTKGGLPPGDSYAILATVQGGDRNPADELPAFTWTLPDGTFRFASPIANSIVTSRIRISAGLAYDDIGGNYYLSSTESNAGAQGNYSVIVNKISGEGDRLWGDGGVTIVPTGTGNQSAFVQTVALGEDCVVAGIDSRSATTDIIFAARVNGDQSIPWSILPSSTVVDKARLAMTQSHCGDVLLAWTNGASGSGDVQAQNIRVGGMLGRTCEADFDGDGFITGQDFDAFVGMFEAGDLCADFDNDGFLTGIDYDAYVQAFEAGC